MLLHVKEVHPELERVVTGNAHSNAPMLAINTQMGFRQYRAGIEYQITRARLLARPRASPNRRSSGLGYARRAFWMLRASRRIPITMNSAGRAARTTGTSLIPLMLRMDSKKTNPTMNISAAMNISERPCLMRLLLRSRRPWRNSPSPTPPGATRAHAYAQLVQ